MREIITIKNIVYFRLRNTLNYLLSYLLTC